MNYQEVREAALQLTFAEREALIDELSESNRESIQLSEDESPFTDEEIRELTTVIPTDPEEVIAMGLIGSMPDLPDGAEWVNARKRERAERLNRKWSQD